MSFTSILLSGCRISISLNSFLVTVYSYRLGKRREEGRGEGEKEVKREGEGRGEWGGERVGEEGGRGKKIQ